MMKLLFVTFLGKKDAPTTVFASYGEMVCCALPAEV